VPSFAFWGAPKACGISNQCYAVGMWKSETGLNLVFLLLLTPFVLPAAQSPAPHLTVPSDPSALLQSAVRSGNLSQAKQLLEAGVPADSIDALGGTPLLLTAWSGQTEMAALLLAHGANVNAAHPEAGSTPLQYAVLTGRVEIVKLLLASGADIKRRYRYGQTVVHIAAAHGSVPILRILLDAKASITDEDDAGNSPLDEAVLHDQVDAVRFLQANGADLLSTHSKDGRGLLHEACVKGFPDMVQFLVAQGVSPSQRDHFGQSPLDLALAYKNTEVVARLLALGPRDVDLLAAGDSAMESATLKGQSELVELLLKAGFNPNRVSHNRSTYLHDAALKNQRKIIEMLLRYGAKLDALNQTGGTALHDAALGGSTDAITVLLNRGAQIDMRDKESGATPLMLAASLARASAVELLLDRGANASLTDYAGQTALARAQKTDDPATIKLLQGACEAGSNGQRHNCR
jgi:ankyrin repeat protein